MLTASKLFMVLGSVNALMTIILGAFGAHALKARLSPEMMAAYQTGIQYHFYHAAGLILVGLTAFHIQPSALLKWSGGCMLIGIILFSGSLYLLSITGIRWLGAVTPIGGIAFILAWALLALAILREM